MYRGFASRSIEYLIFRFNSKSESGPFPVIREVDIDQSDGSSGTDISKLQREASVGFNVPKHDNSMYPTHWMSLLGSCLTQGPLFCFNIWRVTSPTYISESSWSASCHL